MNYLANLNRGKVNRSAPVKFGFSNGNRREPVIGLSSVADVCSMSDDK